MTGIRISVVVPVFRNWEEAAACLRSLADQDMDPARFEIIMVNNDPASLPPAGFGAGAANLVVLDEARPGSYAARNAGLSVARGEIICFTDSDCLAEPDWLRRIDSAFLQGARRVGGKVRLFHRSDRLNPVEAFEELTAFNQTRYVQAGWAATANMAVVLSAFALVGPFDASLMSSGDKEWGMRAESAGIPIAYVEDAIVRHPSRNRFSALSRKARRVEGGKAALRLRRKPRYLLLPFYVVTLPFKVLPLSGRLREILLRTEAPLGLRLKAAAIYQLLRWVRLVEYGRILLGLRAERR